MAQDAITLLDQDHVRVEQLFNQFQSADPSRKEELARTICQELQVHTKIEEEIFYPAFRQAAGDQQLVEEATHEHQEAKNLIMQIEGSGRVDDSLMTQLQQAVMHHVQDERQKMFPKAKQSGMDLAQLGQRLESRKQELMAAHIA